MSPQSSLPLIEALRPFLDDQKTKNIVIGFSGGVDSLVLLHVAHQLTKTNGFTGQLAALHIHHGLSKNADKWALFCENFCKTHEIAFFCQRVLIETPHKNIEESARNVRYQAFLSFDAFTADAFLLAHHQDDLAETMLFNLLRGAGIKGASGMAQMRFLTAQKRLIRPFLNTPKSALLAYAKEHQLQFIVDESNENTRFSRNFLRQEVFPLLATQFKNAPQVFARAAGHFSETQTLLNEISAEDFSACKLTNNQFCLNKINALSNARAKNLLRFILHQKNIKMPEAAWINEALSQLKNAQQNAQIHLQTQGFSLRVFRDVLYILPNLKTPETVPKIWRGEAFIPWNGGVLHFREVFGQGLSRAKLLANPCEIRVKAGSEQLKISNNRPRQFVRNLMHSGKIPPWERALLPLLWCSETLVWAHQIGQDFSFSAATNETGVLLEWEK